LIQKTALSLTHEQHPTKHFIGIKQLDDCLCVQYKLR